ncbi:unnamed protein product, partial [Didymodactylos carnosus]
VKGVAAAIALKFLFLLLPLTVTMLLVEAKYAQDKPVPVGSKVLSDLFGGYSPDTFTRKHFDQLAALTGHRPAIMGCDYACGWNNNNNPENIIDFSCNPSLKNHWSKGGFVTVNMHLPNPVFFNGGGFNNRGNLNFNDLTQPQTSNLYIYVTSD